MTYERLLFRWSFLPLLRDGDILLLLLRDITGAYGVSAEKKLQKKLSLWRRKHRRRGICRVQKLVACVRQPPPRSVITAALPAKTWCLLYCQLLRVPTPFCSMRGRDWLGKPAGRAQAWLYPLLIPAGFSVSGRA